MRLYLGSPASLTFATALDLKRNPKIGSQVSLRPKLKLLKKLAIYYKVIPLKCYLEVSKFNIDNTVFPAQSLGKKNTFLIPCVKIS